MCRIERTFRNLAGLWIGLLVAAVPPDPASAETGGRDWPQWRGPNRDGISLEKGWDVSAIHQGIKPLWTKSVGEGYSAVSVSGGRLYTMGFLNGKDVVWCLDAATGQELWRHTYPCSRGGRSGPRATPTVADGLVYTLSRDGELFCFQADSGRIKWSKNVAREVSAKRPDWGFAGSPLIEGDLVVVNVGTYGAALDKNTGRLVWSTGAEAASYSSPVPFSLGEGRYLAGFAAKAIVGLDVRTGRKVWQYPWKTAYDVNAADPVIHGDKVFITSDYRSGCAVIRIAGRKARRVWQNKNLLSHFASTVLWKGHLYGSAGNITSSGSIRCVDFKTGALKWSHDALGPASLMLADGKLIILSPAGELAIAEATPAGYRQLAKARALMGTCWTVPVLSHRRIYCRSHEGKLVCLDVSGKR